MRLQRSARLTITVAVIMLMASTALSGGLPEWVQLTVLGLTLVTLQLAE